MNTHRLTLRILAVSAWTAIAVLAVCGQEKKAPPATPPTTQAEAEAGGPTELELAKLENIQLRMALLQQEEQSLPQRRSELQTAYGQLIQQIERDHPGYIWNPQINGLMKKPEPAAQPKDGAKK